LLKRDEGHPYYALRTSLHLWRLREESDKGEVDMPGMSRKHR